MFMAREEPIITAYGAIFRPSIWLSLSTRLVEVMVGRRLVPKIPYGSTTTATNIRPATKTAVVTPNVRKNRASFEPIRTMKCLFTIYTGIRSNCVVCMNEETNGFDMSYYVCYDATCSILSRSSYV